MDQPLALDPYRQPCFRGELVAGLSAALDVAAEAGPASHSFLRQGWFAAAGGREPATLVVRDGARVVLALPIAGLGPRPLGLAQVPGGYWPFRSFPAEHGADAAAFGAALAVLARRRRGVRIGPVYDGDPSATPLIAAARGAGWAAVDRYVATSWRLELAELAAAGAWPRGSTLRKNRFHEKHLAAHGGLGWRFLAGVDWPAAFEALGEVEQRSWIATGTDGRDAKFTQAGHRSFWQRAAADPVLAGMMRAAVLEVDGAVRAFSFDLDTGALSYAIANSYDPALAKHSPGKLLQYRNLADKLARGVRTVDWGAGDSGYKAVIGAEPGPALRDWLLLRPGLPALAGRALARWWRASGRREDRT